MIALYIVMAILAGLFLVAALVGCALHTPEPPAAPDTAHRRQLYHDNRQAELEAEAAFNDKWGRG